jgi:hypothetical protein
MRRPVVLWCVVVFGCAAALLNALEVVGCIGVAGQLPLSQVAISLFVFLAIIAASSWMVTSLLSRSLRSRAPVSIYLWCMLLSYPAINVLRAFGLFLPHAELRPEELAGAATVELLRYVLILGLIVWVGFSKALKAHVGRGKVDSARSAVNRQAP